MEQNIGTQTGASAAQVPVSNLQKLHENLSKKDGFSVPFEEFKTDMQDDNNLKRLHENLSKKDGFAVPYEEFRVDMFGGTAVQAPEVQDSFDQKGWDNKGSLDKLTTGIESGWESMKGGIKYAGGVVLEGIDKMDGEEDMQYDNRLMESAKANFNAAPKGKGTLYQLGSFMPQMVGIAAATAASIPTAGTSLAAIPAIIGGANIAGLVAVSAGSAMHEYDQYNEGKEQDGNDFARIGVGIGAGAAEYLAEKIGLGRYLPKGTISKSVTRFLSTTGKDVAQEIGKKTAYSNPSIKGLLKETLKNMAEEGAEESLTESGNILIETLYKDDPDEAGFNEVISRLSQAFGGGALMGGVLSPLSYGSRVAVENKMSKLQGSDSTPIPTIAPQAPIDPRTEVANKAAAFHQRYANKDTGTLKTIYEHTPDREQPKPWTVTKEWEEVGPDGSITKKYLAQVGDNQFKGFDQADVSDQIDEVTQEDFINTAVATYEQEMALLAQQEEQIKRSRVTYEGKEYILTGNPTKDGYEAVDQKTDEFISIPKDIIDKRKSVDANNVTRKYGSSEVTGTQNQDGSIVLSDPMDSEGVAKFIEQVKKSVGDGVTVSSTPVQGENSDPTLPKQYQVTITPKNTAGSQMQNATISGNSSVDPALQSQIAKETPNAPVERKIITQKFGNTEIDIVENEGSYEVIPSEKIPIEKALPVLEKKFKDHPKFKLEIEKAQIEIPGKVIKGETIFDDDIVEPSTKQVVIKSIRIVPKSTKAPAPSFPQDMSEGEFYQWVAQNHKDPLLKQEAIDAITRNGGSPKIAEQYKIYKTDNRNNSDYLKRNVSENVNIPKTESEIVPDINKDKVLQQLVSEIHVTESSQKLQESEKENENSSQNIKPIGKGVFGNIYDQFKGRSKEAIDFLLNKKEGEAIGALNHPEIGEIDLVWGEEGNKESDGYGLSKIVKYHPEVVDNLQEILSEMEVTQRTENRVQLESKKYKAAVRLEWDGVAKTWLLTAFEKTSEATNKTTDTTDNQDDLKNDTAPLQTSEDFNGKDNVIKAKSQVNNEKPTTQPTKAPELPNGEIPKDAAQEKQGQGEQKGLEENVNLNPTEAQQKAGNYKKAHVKIQGMDISIENPVGSLRKGVDEDGKAWEHEMKSHYGYFKKTTGKDGDHIDTFIGSSPESPKVFVIDQINPKTGAFDESKVMIGYNSPQEAKDAYMENYDPNWKGFSAITEIGVEEFKTWLYDGARQHKPFNEYRDTPAPTLTEDQHKTVHNSLIGLVEKFNDTAKNKTNIRSKMQLQILQTALRLGKGYKIETDTQRNLTATKDGKKITRFAIKQSTEDTQAHKALSDYSQELQDFYNRLNQSSSIEFLDIPTSIAQGVRNIAEGKKTVAANDVLDHIERMFTEGVVKLRKTINSPSLHVPIEDYFATFENDLNDNEIEIIDNLPSEDDEFKQELGDHFGMTPDEQNEFDKIFGDENIDEISEDEDVQGSQELSGSSPAQGEVQPEGPAVPKGLGLFDEVGIDQETPEEKRIAEKLSFLNPEQRKAAEKGIKAVDEKLKAQLSAIREVKKSLKVAREQARREREKDAPKGEVLGGRKPAEQKIFDESFVDSHPIVQKFNTQLSHLQKEYFRLLENKETLVDKAIESVVENIRKQGDLFAPPEAEAEKENAGQQEIVIPEVDKQKPLSEVLDAGKKSNVQKMQDAKLASTLEKWKDEIDKSLSEGYVPTQKQVTDIAATNKRLAEYEYLKKTAPWGNENHPETIEMNRLKKEVESGPIKKTSYRLAKDGSSLEIPKTIYDYLKAKESNNPLNPNEIKAVEEKKAEKEKPPSDYGKKNTVFTENAREAALRRLKEGRNNLAAGFDLTQMADLMVLAGYHIEAGARKFVDFAGVMIKDLGPDVKPYLAGLYENIRRYPELKEYKKELDNTEYIDNFDIDNFNPKEDVLDRPGSSKSNSIEPENGLPNDAEDVSGNRGARGGNGDGSSLSGSRGNRRQSSGKSGGGLFTNLFGEDGDNDLRKPNQKSTTESDDARDFDGRGSSTNGTDGLYDGPKADIVGSENDQSDAGSFKERTTKRLILQKEAESIPIKEGDIDNIRETLPVLLPEQQDDVLKAETRFFSPEHNTKEKANGKGFLFTNGTGTGKTYVGLGIIKRFVKQGKLNILIVVPSEAKVNDWAKDGINLGLDITPLPNTSTGGSGVVVTTYANFRENNELKKREFDLVVYDESHRLMEEKKGTPSATTYTHYAISNKDQYSALSRLKEVHPVWIEWKDVFDRHKEANIHINNSPDLMDWQYAERVAEMKKLGARLEYLDEQIKLLEPALIEKAKEAVQRTKVVFLSATPFKAHFNLRYANGVLFDWGNETTHQGYSRVDAESRFFLDNFGGAYVWKFHRLQVRPNSNADAIAMQEVQFAQKLMSEGVMAGRAIESDKDYSREFPLVALEQAEVFNKALNEIYSDEFDGLSEAARSVFSDYNYTTKLFESLKASMNIDRIKNHLELGRKVIVFHRRKQANVLPPFQSILDQTRTKAKAVLAGADENTSDDTIADAQEALQHADVFESKYADLLRYEQTLNYDPAIEQISEAFPGRVVTLNGDTPKKDKSKNVALFNNDNSGKDIIIVQEEAGKEGISLHDTTGKHQRVLINLSLPISSTTALQIEGRPYRIGNESDAIFEYPLLGLDQEIADFGNKINKKLSTTENLAIGDQARDLIRSFAEGVLFNSGIDKPHSNQGKGGKEYDKKAQETLSEFRKAVLIYNTNQKTTGRRDQREGIDYFATPEPVGQKMVEWLNLQSGETALEPSAGHGAIAMWFPNYSNITAIEPSYSLFSKLNARSAGGEKKIVNSTFEDFNIINKFNGVVMNPPFGSGGKTAMDHVEKAFHHLKDGGRLVAIIPSGGSMDKRLNAFMYGENDKGKQNNPNAYFIAEIKLPPSTFEQAGTAVSSRIVIIEKHNKAPENIESNVTIDLSRKENVKDLFDALKDLSFERTVTDQSKPTVIDLINNVERRAAGETEHEGYEMFVQKDSRDNSDLFMVKPIEFLERPEYNRLVSIAKKYDGYFSSYQNRSMNVKAGFLFKSEENRAKFMDEITRDALHEPQVPYQKSDKDIDNSNVNSNFDKNQGDGIPESVSQGEHRALSEADRRVEEISSLIRGGLQTSLRDAQETQRAVPGEKEIEQREAERFAKENGLWIPFSKVSDFGQPFPSGNENEVYYNQKENAVYKVNNLFNSKGISNLLDQVVIHNKLFPQAKYKLIGFTGFDGRSIYPVIKQDHVRNTEFASPQEIAEYMQSLGFTKITDTSFTNSQYTVSDLFPRNVLKDKNGDIYVIDNIIKKNNIGNSDLSLPQSFSDEETRIAFGSEEQRSKNLESAIEDVTKRGIIRGNSRGRDSAQWRLEEATGGKKIAPQKYSEVGKIKRRTVLEGFKESGYVDFLGQKINSPQDIADLWSIHRSPYIEKFHAIFVKNGEIVGSTAITSNCSNRLNPLSSDEVSRLYSKFGADGVYYLHNHPSGNYEVSIADVYSTHKHKNSFEVKGINLLGHVVIDHDKFSFINTRNGVDIPEGNIRDTGLLRKYINDFVETHEYKNAVPKLFTERENINATGDSFERLLEISKALLSENEYKGVIIYLNNAQQITAYDPFPEGATAGQISRIARNGIRANIGSSVAFIHDGSYNQSLSEVTLPSETTDVINAESNNNQAFKSNTFPVIDMFDIETLWEPNVGRVKTQDLTDYLNTASERYKEAREAKRTFADIKEKLREALQDFDLPIRRLEEQIKSLGGVIKDNMKPYRDMSLSYGRTETLYKEFHNDLIKPIIKSASNLIKSGVSGEWILPYVIAKHAIERNEFKRNEELTKWQEENPDARPEEIDAKIQELAVKDYSGVTPLGDMSNFETPDELAQSIVDEFESLADPVLVKELWDNIKQSTNFLVDTWVSSKNMSQEEAEITKERYQYYVPLRGWREGAAKQLLYSKGEGFSKSMQKANGRKSLADNPLAYIEKVGFQAIGEQTDNEVKESLLNLVKENYGGDFQKFYALRKAYYILNTDPVTGEEEWVLSLERPDEQMFKDGTAKSKLYGDHYKLRTASQARENEIIIKKATGDIVVVMKDEFLTVAQAMNHKNKMYRELFTGREMNADFWNKPIGRVLGGVVNLQKAMYTSYNIVFPFTNFLRDVPEASMTQLIKGDDGHKVFGNVAHAFPALIKSFAGKPGTDKYSTYLKEFRENGGNTGWTHTQTPEELEQKLTSMMNVLVRKGTLRGHTLDNLRHVVGSIELWNQLFEDATRLGVYITSREMGKTEKEAAIDAKEASVNFNRKGKLSKAFDALWAFFNVSIQSAQKNLGLAKNYPKAFATASSAWIALGFFEAMMNEAMQGDDDDEKYSNITPWVRANYLILPNLYNVITNGKGNNRYIRIPLPQFWRGFKSVGSLMYEVKAGRVSIPDAMIQGTTNFMSSLTPFDIPGLYQDGKVNFSPIAPTAGKPFFELWENRDYTGNQIYKTPFTKEQEGRLADSKLGKNNVSPIIKLMTDAMFRAGGGDSENRFYMAKDEIKEVKGLLDVNPSRIEHILTGYTGGTGRFVSDLMTTAFQTVTHEPVDPKNIPFVNAFVKKIPEAKWAVINKFYELGKDSNVDKFESVKRTYMNDLKKMAISEGDIKKAEERFVNTASNRFYNEYSIILKSSKDKLDAQMKAMDFSTAEGSEDIMATMNDAVEEINKIKQKYNKP